MSPEKQSRLNTVTEVILFRVFICGRVRNLEPSISELEDEIFSEMEDAWRDCMAKLVVAYAIL